MSGSVVEPGWRQIVAPFRSLTERTFDALRTMNPVPSYQLIAGNSMPSWTSRWKVTVVLRERTSISPDCSAVKRCAVVSGVYRTLRASPSTAAAIARHTSTSMPCHCPLASSAEKPAMPVLTPHRTKSLERTLSSVGVAVDGWPAVRVAAIGTDWLRASPPEHAAAARATHDINRRVMVVSPPCSTEASAGWISRSRCPLVPDAHTAPDGLQRDERLGVDGDRK